MITVIKHAPHEGLGSFERAVRGAGHSINVIDASLAGPAQWKAAREAQVLFVMGGAMGIYDSSRYAFLAHELELLEKRILLNAPTFGVCLGAQLIAQAAGARVRVSGHREIGWFEVRLTAQGVGDKLVGELSWDCPVFHWHGDTFDTPPGAVSLLSSQRFSQQGFRIGDHIYGVQFHPEVTAGELPLWLASEPEAAYGQADGVQTQQQILDGGRHFGAALEALSQALIQRYLALIS